VTESQAASLVDSKDLMTVEEQLLCFYIFSLTLLKQCVIVLRLIKKFLIKFTTCSGVFQGNVMRAKAICCMTLLKDESKATEFQPVLDSL
jgi:hypothetical protein